MLEEVHARFFSAYNARLSTDKAKKRRPGSSAGKTKLYDVTVSLPGPHFPLGQAKMNTQDIIPRMRSETLKDVHILFSSVIPLDTKPELTEIWKVAHMFGAKCYTELSNLVTHVVAAKVSHFDRLGDV